MKEFEFNEDQLKDIDSIAKSLFETDDPRSTFYKRKLVRPKINWLRVFISVLLPPAVLALLCYVYTLFDGRTYVAVISASVLLALYYAANLKDAAICCVKIYQRYAPAAIRNRCRFEPSCSEYMILSLEKYGLFKGLKKGFNRMHRCNANDGGYDYP